jgi:hypothetical protein
MVNGQAFSGALNEYKFLFLTISNNIVADTRLDSLKNGNQSFLNVIRSGNLARQTGFVDLAGTQKDHGTLGRLGRFAGGYFDAL